MFSQPTWNKLGLGVAAGFAALGVNWFANPPVATTTAREPSRSDLIALIGIRDLCFAAALFALGFRGSRLRSGDNAAGTVILAVMPMCALDAVLLWKWNRKTEYVEPTAMLGDDADNNRASMAAVGAGIWAGIALGMKGFYIRE